MSVFTERLKTLRKNCGLSQDDLAKMLEVGKTTISNYETEYSMPDVKTTERIASLFDVTVDYLLGRSDKPKVQEPIEIMVLGTVRAGIPCAAVEDVIGHVFLPRELVGGHEYFGLKVKGDSMNQSRICENDIVVVKKQNYAENGDIVVALVGDDEATVKRYFQSGEMVTLMPNSTNKTYEPIVIDTTKTRLHIMGVVEQTIISFK